MNTTTATPNTTAQTPAAPAQTWEERRNAERAAAKIERAEFFKVCRVIVAELNEADAEAKTGAKWQLIETDPNDEETLTHWDKGKHAQIFRLTTAEAAANYHHDSGGEVLSLRPVFCKAGKMQAHGTFNGLQDYRPHDRKAHEIGYSEGKAPRLIAADIVRRLLADYRAELKQSRETRDAVTKRREGAEAFARELCQKSRGGFVYNAQQDEKSTQRTAHIYRKTKDSGAKYPISGDLRTYSDGTAKFTLENVPAALAAKICELIGAEIE